ncbi:MAG: DEAD/DEAH box helicase [Scrofimicrobium sp.]
MTSQEPERQARFSDLPLEESQLQILSDLGFEHPTPIQQASIPLLMDGRDVIGIAQTGTGKTAAFGLPLLARMDLSLAAPQALVLAPTRELALQTSTALEALAGPNSKLKFVTVYGGASYAPQLQALKQGSQVVVGTPGRLIDLIDRGALDLSHINTLVLDEADEMLRMGFAEEVDQILASVPDDRLTALFSATMPAGIAKVAQKYLTAAQRVEVSSQSSTVSTIDQTYTVIQPKMRFEALCRFLAVSPAGAAIVFVRTRKDAEEVSLSLSARGFRAAGISGDVAQRERERLLDGLRRGYLDVLVATDVAARGIDVDRVGLVVNYEVPREDEQYVHRVGRTGRAGREGQSLTFFTPRDVRKLRSIERTTGSSMHKVAVPTAEQVRLSRATGVLDNALSAQKSVPDAVLTLLDAKREEGLRYRDIAAALLTQTASPQALGEISTAAQDRMDDAFEAATPSATRKKGRADFTGKGKRYRIEVGRRDGVSPGGIVGAITGEAGLEGSAVGKIDIFPSFSVVQVDQELSEAQMKRIDRATLRGRRIRISVDRGGSKSGKPSFGGKSHGKKRDYKGRK